MASSCQNMYGVHKAQGNIPTLQNKSETPSKIRDIFNKCLDFLKKNGVYILLAALAITAVVLSFVFTYKIAELFAELLAINFAR